MPKINYSQLFWLQDIGLKIISGQKVDVTLINNDLLSIGFITIILTEDEQTFIANEEMVKTCGQSLEKAGPFEPKYVIENKLFAISNIYS